MNNNYNTNIKNYIYFCPNCNVPIIEKKCLICMTDGNKIIFSQFTDIRIAMKSELKIINDLLYSFFSFNPLQNKILILVKIPGEDFTAKIITDGIEFGTLIYSLTTLKYNLILSKEGVKILFSSNKKNDIIFNEKIIILKNIDKHINNKKIAINSIQYFPESIQSGDPVLVKYKNMIGYGIALVSGSNLKENLLKKNYINQQLLKIKLIFLHEELLLSENTVNMDMIIKANVKYLQLLGKKSLNFIKGYCNKLENRDNKIYVAFSGGKDSLVCLDLTKKALNKNFSALFLNTGIDYEETVNFVHEYCKLNNIDLIELNAGDIFWKKLKLYDHPTKDNRWCCETCKLQLLTKLCSPKQTFITVDGKRKYESFNRSKIKNIEINKKIKNQINIYPIRNWRAIEVWLYIYWRKLNYNELYNHGLERIGCWMCPSALQSEYEIMCNIHSEYKI